MSSDEEAAKRYEAAWATYENETAALRKAHSEALDLARKRFREMKTDADRAFGTGQQKAWQKFRETTGHE